jgi:hypothetical protein
MLTHSLGLPGVLQTLPDNLEDVLGERVQPLGLLFGGLALWQQSPFSRIPSIDVALV